MVTTAHNNCLYHITKFTGEGLFVQPPLCPSQSKKKVEPRELKKMKVNIYLILKFLFLPFFFFLNKAYF